VAPLQKLRKALREKGVLGTARSAMRRGLRGLASFTPSGIRRAAEHRFLLATRAAVDDDFDRYHGVDTGGTILQEGLGVARASLKHSTRYQAILPQPFREVIASLPIRLEESVFVDFGSGKGRAVLLASEFPFRKVVGVEFSPRLHQLAETNCRCYRNATRKCRDISLLCLDVLDYEIPSDPLVLHFHNPFGAAVMERVCSKVARSLSEHPRPVFVIYFNPLVRKAWDAVRPLKAYPFKQPSMPGFPVLVWTAGLNPAESR